MNLIYGEIVEVSANESGILCGRIRVGGALKGVTLDLLPETDIGDEVLVCDGIAIGKVRGTGDPARNLSNR